MKYFELGMKVYCHMFGDGIVFEIKEDELDYPIIVAFKGVLEHKGFTHDGRYMKDLGISLSKTPLQPIVNKPIKEKVMGYFWDDAKSKVAIYGEYSHSVEKNFY